MTSYRQTVCNDDGFSILGRTVNLEGQLASQMLTDIVANITLDSA